MMEESWMNLIMMLSLSQVVGKQKEQCEKEIKTWVLETCEEDCSMASFWHFEKCLDNNLNELFCLDESDDDDESRPARKRRLAERAAEGMEVQDDKV
jgi:hypothetical protein